MRRVVTVARIQAINWTQVIALPLMVLLGAFVVNLAILAVIAQLVPAEHRVTGALSAIYGAMAIAHLQTMTQFFPFASGLSVTRREFAGATGLVIAGQAALFALVMTIGAQLEVVTGGWGLGGRFFAVPLLPTDPVGQWVVFAATLAAFGFLGAGFGVVLKRWGQWGGWTVSIGVAVLAVAVVAVITWQGWWGAVGAALAGLPVLVALGVLPLVVAALAAGGGWLALRHATP